MTEIPEHKNWITTGNLITLGVLLVSIVLAYGSLESASKSHAKTLTEHDQRIYRLESQLTNSLSRIETDLIWIKREIGK